MKKSFLLSVIFALALVDSALAGATYRLAIRDDAGHLLGTDPSVCYRYKVYNETRGEYTHDKDTTFAVSLIDGGTHNIEFTVETSVWQTGYPCDTNDVLRVEILNANEGNFPIGTITGLAPVGDFVTPILTPTIRATPTPTNPEGEEVDLIRLLADEDSYVNYSMYCAGVESYFGGGWKDDQDRDGDGLSDGLERMLGTDPYGGALSKEEVRQALKAAHFPDLARPNGFESDLTLTENGLVLAAFTHSVGHAYGLRWLRDFSDEGVCLELCDENRKLLGKKAQAVEIKEGMTATDQVIFGLLSDEQMASGCVALTVDGYIVETVELNVGPYDPVGVHVNGVDIGRGRGWGWTYTNEVLTLSGRYAYSLAGTNRTNDVRIEVKNPLSLTFNRLELTSSAAPITVGESAHLTIAGGSAKFVGGDVVSPVPVIVEGGSVSASLTDARSPDGRKLWRVKVPDVSEEGLLEFKGLPVDYRTNDIYALDGELSLWLPNGIYRFTVNGKRYYAAVADAEVTAIDYWPMFMYVDGRDIGCGIGEGWAYSEEFKTLAFTNCTSATLSGTNETSSVKVVTREDLELFFDRVKLVNEKNVFATYDDAKLTLAGGTATLIGGSEGVSSDSIVVAGGSFFSDLTNAVAPDGKKVWCVKVSGLESREALALSGLPSYYRTDGIYAVDGRVCLWLPDGIYRFTIDGVSYLAKVNGADVEAFKGDFIGLTVNGLDVAFGRDAGWEIKDDVIKLTGEGPFVLSGADAAGRIGVVADTDTTVTFENLTLSSEKTPFEIAVNRSVRLLLKGDNRLTAKGDTCAALHPNMGSSLVIDRAEGCTDAEAQLVAYGGREGGAGIGCGKNEMMGDIEIKGGTVAATGGMNGAGIGAGDSGGAGGEGDDPKRARIVVSGGVVTAQGGREAAGIGCGTRSWGPRIEIAGGRIKAVGGTDSCSDVGAAFIAQERIPKSYTTIAISGGTVEAERLGSMIESREKAQVTITGGSVLATTVAPDPTNGVATVYRVTVEGLTDEGVVTLGGLPAGYGTSDIFAVDGKVCLWLPNGVYHFTLNGKRYYAEVAGAAVTALDYWPVGVCVDGQDIGCGSGEGWSLANDVLTLTGEGSFVLSGTDADERIRVLVDADVQVTFDNLSLAGKATPFAVANNHAVTLLLKGGNSLTAKGEGCAAVHVYETSSLVIDRAEDGIDTEALLVALGAKGGAGIGCGKYEMLGDIEIKGGTIEAKGGNYGAGIGAGDGGGAGGEGDDPKRAKIVVSGGVVTAQGGIEASGIGCGKRSWGPQIEISGGQIKAVGGENSYADIGSAFIDQGGIRKSHTTIAISGGTVEAERLGSTSEPQIKALVTITGGSTLATTVAPDPTNGVATVYRVSIKGLTGEEALTFEGLPPDYGTSDIYAMDGKVCLWLPDGAYGFSVNGVSYLARVKGADTDAVKGSLVGLTVNGVDVAFGSDEGWSLANDVLNLTGEGPFVLSGADADERISVLVDTDATVTFDNLSLACKATPFTVATNRVVTLLLKGDNGLTAKGDGRAAVHAYETSSLVIDRAEGCTDAEAQLVALGATGGAGIGCGRNEMMGDIEIKGGTIEATGRNRGAGIGAGEGGGAGGVGKDPRRAKIVISGGVVTAQGGDWAAGIGAGYQSWGPRIEIAGGQVKATGGKNSSSDIGSAVQPNSRSYTTIAISGGTVEAERLGWSGYDPQTKAQVTITGGSVLANAVAPDPTNGVATVYRVTVEGLTDEGVVTLGGLPAGYGTHDIFAVDGKVCLWLPDGRYVFSVDGVPYLAKVAGGDTTAKVLNLTAVIRMGEDGHAIVEPSESVEGCTYSVKASETLDFTDCVIVPVGRIEDLRYHFFRVIVLAVCE